MFFGWLNSGTMAWLWQRLYHRRDVNMDFPTGVGGRPHFGPRGRAMIEKPTHGEQPRPPAGEKGGAAGTYRISRRWRSLKLIIVGAVVLIALLAVISGLIQKGLWMQQLGYTGVFWTLLSLRWELFCAAFVVALLYLWINLRLAARNGATFRAGHLTSRVHRRRETRHPDLSRGFEAGHGRDRCCRRPDLCGSSSMGNGIRISAFVMADPLGCPILSSGSMSGFICSVSPFMSFCRAA